MAAQATSKSGRKKVRCPKCTALFPEPAKAVFECPICACRLLANGVIAVPESPSPRPKDEDSAQIETVTEPMKMQSSTSIRKEGSSSVGNGTTREENSISCEQESVDSCTQIYKENQQQFTVDVRPVFTSGDSNEQPSLGSAMEGVVGENGVHPPIHSGSKQADVVGRNERVESLLLSRVEGGKEDGNSGSTVQQCPSDDMLKGKPLTTEDERVEEKGCLINGASSNRRHLQSQMFRTSRSEFSFKYSLRGASLMESDRNLPDQKRVPASKLVSSGAALPDTEKTDVSLRTPLRVRISKSQGESSDQSEQERHSFGSDTYSDDDDDGSGSDFDFPAPWAEGLQDIVLPTSLGQSEVSHFDSKAVISAAPHQLELQDNDDAIAEVEISSKVEYTGEARERKSELRNEEPSHGFAQPVSMHEKNHVSLWPPERAETASELRPPSRDTQILDVSNLGSCVSSCMLSDNLVVAESNEVRESSDNGEEGEAGQQENLANMEPRANAQQEAFKPSGAAFGPSGVVVPDRVGGAHDSHSISKTGGFQTVDLQKDVEPVHNHQNLMSSGKIKNELFSSLNDQRADGPPPSLMEMEQSNGVSNATDGSPPCDRQVLSSPIEHAEVEEDLYRLPVEAHGNGSIFGGSSRSALWAEEETAVSVLSDTTLVNASKARLYHERRNHHKSLHGKPNGKPGSRLAGNDANEDLFMSGHEGSLWGPAASQDPPPQAVSELGDWEGHITARAEQTRHPALHELERNPGLYSQYPVNNSLGYAPANPQPYALTNQIYPYQLPAQPLVCPAALQNRAFSHCGYHSMSPTCMLCSYHQHPHMQPQHIGHCGACLNQSGSVAYNSARVEFWNSHQAHHGSASSCAGSLVDYPQACLSIQRHDFFNTEDRSQTSSVRNATQYPPFPNIGAAPYVTCKGCSRVLQVPPDLHMSSGTMQKLRCGACGKVTKFSINYHDQQRGVVSSIPPPEMDPVGGFKNSLVDYGNHSRQLPINLEIERMKSPYKHDMLKGNSVSHWANDTSPQVNGITGSRALEQSSQGRDAFRVQQPSGDTSLSTSNQPSIIGTVGGPSFQHASSQGGVMSPRNAAATTSATSYGFERLKVNPAASFHPTVDEKEEGLDFGAPRISDGDSLDQSESRMRSPENYQPGHEANQISQGGAVTGNQPSEQLSDWNVDHTDQDKKPGSPLLVLLNQESTRFRLNIQPRVPLQESGSAAWSPASDSVLYGKSTNDNPQNREQSKVRSHGSPGQHFVSKGPKYIAGLLRRSLRDFGKGGQ